MANTLQETIREDGLRVITKRLLNTKKVILSISALAGSADDHEDKEGLLHFFEHMAFKGTTTKNRKEINKLLGLFVSPNAYTAWLRTCYYASSASAYSALLENIIFDIYLNPVFPDEEIQKEKEVIINETALNENDDCAKAENVLARLLYKKNPVRRVSCGTANGLSLITREVLFEEHGKWYVPSNTAVVAVGDINHAKLAERVFSFFPLKYSKLERPIWDYEFETLPSQDKVIVERKDRDSGVVLWGCKVPNVSERDRDIIRLLSEMIGGGLDSMLYEEVREERGFVYLTWSQFQNINNLASSLLFGGLMLPARIDEVAKLIFEVACNYSLDKDHFTRTKAAIFNSLLIGLGSHESWVGTIHQKILDERCDVSILYNYSKKRISDLSSITFEEVLAMRKKLIVPERMACVIIKPV